MRAPLLPATAMTVTALTAVALTAGCSLGRSDFNGNHPDTAATQQEVVRTPSPLGTDLPYTDPPVLQPLPGPSGGYPLAPPTTIPPNSPGAGNDGGGNGGPGGTN